MKRDWDLIREVLLEVEAVPPEERNAFRISAEDEDLLKVEHALLLVDAGFIEGTVARNLSGPPLLLRPALTWQGHELLDTIRSKAVWERIKTTASSKGIELTFDAVKALGALALQALIGS